MKLLTAQEVSDRWRGLISTNTLANWRSDPARGKGPPFRKLGGRVVYPEDSLIEWEQANLFHSTEEYQAKQGRPKASDQPARRLDRRLEALDAELEAKRNSLAEARAIEDRQLEEDYAARRSALAGEELDQDAPPKRGRGRHGNDAPRGFMEPAPKRPRGRPKGSRDRVARKTPTKPISRGTLQK